MRMREGERWHCINSDCRCEVVVALLGQVEGHGNPKCCCGAAMKKQYTRPVMKAIRNRRELECFADKLPAGPRAFAHWTED